VSVFSCALGSSRLIWCSQTKNTFAGREDTPLHAGWTEYPQDRLEYVLGLTAGDKQKRKRMSIAMEEEVASSFAASPFSSPRKKHKGKQPLVGVFRPFLG
jgi:hypothetical protein